jgi:two-component system, chemotaxis family, protein-glutamate methylesterase/glutaminase
MCRCLHVVEWTGGGAARRRGGPDQPVELAPDHDVALARCPLEHRAIAHDDRLSHVADGTGLLQRAHALRHRGADDCVVRSTKWARISEKVVALGTNAYRAMMQHRPDGPLNQCMRRAASIGGETISDGHDGAFAEFGVVVVATSLGGREALELLLAPLAADFPAPIVVVQHVDAHSPSYLPELLAKRTRLAVHHAASDEPLLPSVVYVAPPGLHLLVGAEGQCLLSGAPPVAFSRPSADLLFGSAADVFGARTLGVILTGRLRDGTAGAEAIRRAGGVVLAQDPATCRAPEMPLAAIRQGAVHLALPPTSLGDALSVLLSVPGARAMLGLATHAA